MLARKEFQQHAQSGLHAASRLFIGGANRADDHPLFHRLDAGWNELASAADDLLAWVLGVVLQAPELDGADAADADWMEVLGMSKSRPW